MTNKLYPAPVVGALIFNQNGKLLLLKSHKWHDQYMLPGGHIEWGEKIEEAIEREVREETQLKVYDIKFLNVQEAIFDKQFFKKKHFVFLDYTCKTKSAKVVLNSEAEEYKWVTLKQALKMPVNSYTRVAIKDIYKNTALQ